MGYGHRYSEEECIFFQSYAAGHTHEEIRVAFIQHFGWEISIAQIKGYLGNHRITTGTLGQFKKGQTSYNKGMKGLHIAGSEKGWFCKGHVPANHKPVGSERINVDGYVEIKVEEPKKWRLKHLVIWEQHYGPVPKGNCIIFLDRNKSNLDIKNLRMIRRKDLIRMNQEGLFSQFPELTETGIHTAELLSTIGEVKRRKKKIS